MVFNEAYWAKARQMRLAHVLSERPIDLDDKSSFNAIVSYINGSAPHTRLRMWPNEIRDGIHALTLQLDESQKQAEIIQSFGKQTSSEGASPKRAREEMIVSTNPGKRIKDGRDIEDEQPNLPTSPQTIYDRTISARSSATLVSSK